MHKACVMINPVWDDVIEMHSGAKWSWMDGSENGTVCLKLLCWCPWEDFEQPNGLVTGTVFHPKMLFKINYFRCSCSLLQPSGVLSVVVTVCGRQVSIILLFNGGPDMRTPFLVDTLTYGGSWRFLEINAPPKNIISDGCKQSYRCLTIQTGSPGTLTGSWSELLGVPVLFHISLTVIADRIELNCSAQWKRGICLCVCGWRKLSTMTWKWRPNLILSFSLSLVLISWPDTKTCWSWGVSMQPCGPNSKKATTYIQMQTVRMKLLHHTSYPFSAIPMYNTYSIYYSYHHMRHFQDPACMVAINTGKPRSLSNSGSRKCGQTTSL